MNIEKLTKYPKCIIFNNLCIFRFLNISLKRLIDNVNVNKRMRGNKHFITNTLELIIQLLKIERLKTVQKIHVTL